MATFDSVKSGTLNMLENTVMANTIDTMSTMARGVLIDLASVSIADFKNYNALNHQYMDYHMMRNIYEKEATLNMLGANAYPDGDGDNLATPAQYPTYTKGNNYVEFVSNVRGAEKSGMLTTRIATLDNSNLFNSQNLYLDSDYGFGDETTTRGGNSVEDGLVQFTGESTDRNSILYKTKKLINENKLKTIISKFHTEGVEYNGQIGSEFGESHGRNLLTKQAENGGDGYAINGFDNPYCRVWTHHYQYDRLAKTMRAKSGGMNTWGGFEWDDTDKGHGKDNTKYGDGENYDYAWRGKHNQDRIAANSVLDRETGLVKITPQYRGGRESNRHTKECMFSIENLAWKDYDPYSFEQALSWEQRGPLGGRIMWFPPYGIEITETASAKWNTNEFIGRGEPVYTYVNSERTGNLSFLMITDHPSSIDYASWWDDNGTIKGISDGETNSENDYLRYFAGCSNNDADGNGNRLINKEDNLVKKPTPLTDEYIQENPPLIKADEKEPTPDDIPKNTPPAEVPLDDKTEETIGFFVFYPNNYSGINDKPFNEKSKVSAIAYLLAGRNAQKLNGDTGEDSSLDDDMVDDMAAFEYDYIIPERNVYECIGYEMGRDTGISTDDCINATIGVKEYIQGGKQHMTPDKYQKETDKKWQYRVDHKLRDELKNDTLYYGGDNDATNTLNQTLVSKADYKDTKSFRHNLEVKINDETLKKIVTTDTLYSFAEVAAALYSENLNDEPFMFDYLRACGVDLERVKTLIDLFGDKSRPLLSATCTGYANSQGYNPSRQANIVRNINLAYNRAATVVAWLNEMKGKVRDDINVTNGSYKTKNENTISKEEYDEAENFILKVNSKDVNDEQVKLYRCAYCRLTFGTSTAKSATQTDTVPEMVDVEPQNESSEEVEQQPKYECKEYVGFRYLRTETKSDGSIWNYYEKDGSVKYYEQEVGSKDNYDNPETNDVIVTEQQILDIFKTFAPTQLFIMEDNQKYRGDYNDKGFYIDSMDYKDTYFVVYEFTDTGMYTEGQIVEYKGSVYRTTRTHNGEWNDEDFVDITNLKTTYAEGDFVKHEDKYYKCKVNFIEEYSDYEFIENDWTKITPENIQENLNSEYTYQSEMPEGGYKLNDVIFKAPGNFHVCLGYDTQRGSCFLDEDDGWEEVTDYPIFDETNFLWDDNWNTDTLIIYKEKLYKWVSSINHTETTFNPLNWIAIDIPEFSCDRDYREDDMVWDGNTLFRATTEVIYTAWSNDITKCIKNLIFNTKDNPMGDFDGNYLYLKDDVCCYNGYYYRAKKDISEQEPRTFEFNPDDWDEATDKDLYKYEFEWYTEALAEKAAAVLCLTVDEMARRITNGAESVVYPSPNDYSCIWKYGITNNFVTPELVNTSTNLVNYINESELNSQDSSDNDARIRFTTDEQNYLSLIIENSDNQLNMQTLRQYIVAYRLLDGINFIEDEAGQRKTCSEAAKDNEEMKAKTERIDESETDGCDNVWVDRGDGLLIQECNIGKENGAKARFNAETGEGDWNKLRYDQEYHFYKQYMADHPLVFDKLQEKIKYFNPAFHSMTPEGFNARLTFLQQCTRQGNTKTMSDISGKTANNLAFGRPPYCVLRLGDFYNQLIVIDSISFDYSVSGGLQWDLNTEGNGVQPMLCKVNISFKFIGGGDITGPVQRLQNAMSFNYYANTSFYDNRADRPQYQDTNWETMGGAGNNQLDYEKSYAYIAKQYEKPDPNIVTGVK